MARMARTNVRSLCCGSGLVPHLASPPLFNLMPRSIPTTGQLPTPRPRQNLVRTSSLEARCSTTRFAVKRTDLHELIMTRTTVYSPAGQRHHKNEGRNVRKTAKRRLRLESLLFAVVSPVESERAQPLSEMHMPSPRDLLICSSLERQLEASC